MARKRNIYKLEDLSPKVIVEDGLKQILFAKSEELRKFDYLELLNPWESIEGNDDIEEYYVLFEYIIHKGKQKIFKGETAIISRAIVAKFVKKIIEEDQERPIRILPKGKDYSFLIRINDESTCYLYQDN
jgi:hypothetical protein